jgi:hypothetical protein
MSLPRLMLVSCLIVALGAWFVASVRQVEAQQAPDPAPQEVTTDTPDYCIYLKDRVQSQVQLASNPPPREVTDLSAEGQRMCEHGQTRGGIMRLRRALFLLTHDEGLSPR